MGKVKGPYGSRIPMVRLLTGTPFVKVYSSINGKTGNGYSIIGDIETQLGEWTYIEISQTQEPLGYNYSVFMNGKPIA